MRFFFGGGEFFFKDHCALHFNSFLLKINVYIISHVMTQALKFNAILRQKSTELVAQGSI